jgi:hypothetical protein
MKTKDLLTAAAAGLVAFFVARAMFGPDKYGLDRNSAQSRMLAEQDAAFL